MIAVIVMLQQAAELDLKWVALKKEAYSNFTTAIAGTPVPKLWDLFEAAFGSSSSEDGVEEEDPDTNHWPRDLGQNHPPWSSQLPVLS